MRNKYSGKDLSDRLHGTLIRYEGKPYQAMVDGSSINLHSLTTGTKFKTVKASDDALDISSLPLGYVNYAEGRYAVYISRTPARRFKQGVDPGAMQYRVLTAKGVRCGAEVFNSTGFQDHMDGIYPDLHQALILLTSSTRVHESVALSSEIALLKEKDVVKVYLDVDEVGFISLKGDRRVCKIFGSSLSWVHRSVLNKVGIEVVEGI